MGLLLGFSAVGRDGNGELYFSPCLPSRVDLRHGTNRETVISEVAEALSASLRETISLDPATTQIINDNGASVSVLNHHKRYVVQLN
ncbi:hypothetical protein ACFL0C_02155 [Patescibacteria group bacterium]